MNTVKYQIKENVLFQKVVEETVILEPNTGEYFTLDPIGTVMVEKIQDGLTFDEVVNSITDVYDVEAEEVENDLNQLISEMKDKDLLTEIS